MSIRRTFGITGGGVVLALVGFVGYRYLDPTPMVAEVLVAGSPGPLSAQTRAEVAVEPKAASSRSAVPIAFDSVLLGGPSLSTEPRHNEGVDPTRAVTFDAAGSEGASPPAALLIPVAGVRQEQLVDTYFQARSEGRSHDAIDIIAPRGTPVVAVAAGTVLKLFPSKQGGITLYELAADQRTVYYYAHLDHYSAGMVEGARLRPGDVIGYVGDTGNAGAGNYHLHFEISTTENPAQYWGGTPINPYPILQGTAALPR
jgi:peptidoglycan LD-endopeptidase LytH